MERPAGNRVAVVGAGIAGLAAAHELSKHGVDVTVFEETERPGGRMNTQTIGRLAFDSGADFFSENYRAMKGYAAELGIEWLATLPNSRHRVIRGGQPFYLKFATPGDLFRFRLLSPWSRLRLAAWLAWLAASRKTFDLFDLSSMPPAYDFDKAADYVGRVVSKEAADYLVDSFTSLMQFHRANEISTAGLFSLMSMMISKNRRFSLCSTPNGLNEIPRALAKRLTVRYRQPVKSVKIVSNNNTLWVTAAGRDPERFDAVVLAVPAPVAKQILSKKLRPWQKFFARVRYASTMVVAFRVPDDLFSDGAHLTYVPFVESALIGGYTNEAAKGGKRRRRGQTLLNVYLHEEAARPMMGWSDTRVFRAVAGELMKLCPELKGRSSDLVPAAVARWPLAMPKFGHRYVSAVREFMADHQGERRLYLAGDYLNAPWTEGAARSGQRAAAAVINQLS